MVLKSKGENVKKILISLSVATILASSAFACKNANMGMGCSSHKMMSSYKNKSGKLVGAILNAFSKTAPSTEQIKTAKRAIEKFRDSMSEFKSKKKFPIETLTETEFDKDLFASICLKKSAQKIQSKVDLIDKIYSTLDEQQKREFKTEFASNKILKELMR